MCYIVCTINSNNSSNKINDTDPFKEKDREKKIIKTVMQKLMNLKTFTTETYKYTIHFKFQDFPWPGRKV